MRIIGHLSNEIHARRFAGYLTSKKISNRCEVSFDALTSHMAYQIWIHDEDLLQEASQELQEFQKNPTDSKYDSAPPEPDPQPSVVSEVEEPPPEPHRFKNYLTLVFIFLCIFFFMVNMGQEKEILDKKVLVMTPLQNDFMIDPPVSLEAPYWHGIYDWVVAKIKEIDPAPGLGPLFTKVGDGEIWRLFTPALLHNDLLHILFNMLWLWYLGRPIEQRIGPLRTLLLTLLLAIFSNTVQYMMSGPLFFGYSGIITGLAGFIWMRERVAPWEGYPLNRSTILFLLFFIGAIFLLQMIAFFIQIFTALSFSPNIANSAHIAGALLGALLGRFHFFAQRVHK